MSVRLVPGAYALPPIVFGRETTASEVRLQGEEGTVLRLATSPSRRRLVPARAEAHVLTIEQGAPPVYLEGLRIASALRVNGGSLRISRCTLGHADATLRALSVSGGLVSVERTTLTNATAGAIAVSGGHVEMSDSVLRENRAEEGGAMSVSGGSVTATRCRFEDNDAAVEGGGLFATGGTVALGNLTLLRGNSAPVGASISARDASLSYVLPAPLTRYVRRLGSRTTRSRCRRSARCCLPRRRDAGRHRARRVWAGVCDERRHLSLPIRLVDHLVRLSLLVPEPRGGQLLRDTRTVRAVVQRHLPRRLCVPRRHSGTGGVPRSAVLSGGQRDRRVVRGGHVVQPHRVGIGERMRILPARCAKCTAVASDSSCMPRGSLVRWRLLGHAVGVHVRCLRAASLIAVCARATGHWCSGGAAVPCEIGFYNEQAGANNQSACGICPPQSSSPRASRSLYACKCNPGFFNEAFDGVRCVPCILGSGESELY